MRNLWFVIVAAILTVSCSAPSAEQDRVVIEGLIDIALPAGMFIPKSCTEGTPGESEYLENNRACVAYKFTEGDSDQNYDGAVLKALSENDWEFAGGAGNAYYLERSINAECSDKMMVVAVIQGDPAEVTKWGRSEEPTMDWSKIENAIYQFVPYDEPVCGDDKFAGR